MNESWRDMTLGDLVEEATDDAAKLAAVKAVITLAQAADEIIRGFELPEGYEYVAKQFVDGVNDLADVTVVILDPELVEEEEDQDDEEGEEDDEDDKFGDMPCH